MKEKWLFPLTAIFTRKVYLLLFCFVGLHSYVGGQVITVKGKDTGLPLVQATISSQAKNAFTITDLNGQANLTEFHSADDITIRTIGYEEIRLSFKQLKDQSFLILLNPDNYLLDQIVVSATRWRNAERNIPAKVSLITAKEVALQNPQTTADLLGNSGEVFIQKSQLGGGSPMIRGFSTNRLLYSVDGVRMNTAIFRSGNLQNVISLDPFAIERSEIYFGPGSVIYGSDAIGGVMSFQTLEAKLGEGDGPTVKGNALSRFSSANKEQTFHFDVNVGWKKWAYVASFSHFDFDHLRMGSVGPESYLRPTWVQRQDSTDVVITNEDPLVQRPTAYNQINMMQKLRYKPSAAWDLTYAFHYSTTSDYARYDRHIRLRNGLPRSAEWRYGPQVWMMNNLMVKQEQAGGGLYDKMNLRLAHQRFEESRINRDFRALTRFHRAEAVEALSANLDLLKRFGAGGQLLYGLEAVYNDVRSIGRDENIETQEQKSGAARYPNSNWGSYAAYLTIQQRFSAKVLFEAGVRYNQYRINADFDTRFFDLPFSSADLMNDAVSGSLGLVIHPNPTWTLSTNLATGFRAPNIDDIGKVFDSEPGAVVVPNPDLKAEQVYSAELGLSKRIREQFKFDVTAYYTVLDNALVRRNFTLNGASSIEYQGEMSQVQALQNAAQAIVMGLQIGIEWKLPSGFGFSTQLNIQEGEEELHDGSTSPSRHAPPAFGISHLTYKVDQLELDLSWVFNAEKPFEQLPIEERSKTFMYATDELGRPFSPAWNTLNFRALLSFTEQFSASAGIENLLDIRYRPYSSGLVAPGRNLVLSFRAMF
ncbi:MAG: TonB-dependent receptor [Saprospiraceae bacterium]|nr:TonB-dependent receptor [Saprospiraceae bacterium]